MECINLLNLVLIALLVLQVNGNTMPAQTTAPSISSNGITPSEEPLLSASTKIPNATLTNPTNADNTDSNSESEEALPGSNVTRTTNDATTGSVTTVAAVGTTLISSLPVADITTIVKSSATTLTPDLKTTVDETSKIPLASNTASNLIAYTTNMSTTTVLPDVSSTLANVDVTSGTMTSTKANGTGQITTVAATPVQTPISSEAVPSSSPDVSLETTSAVGTSEVHIGSTPTAAETTSQVDLGDASTKPFENLSTVESSTSAVAVTSLTSGDVENTTSFSNAPSANFSKPSEVGVSSTDTTKELTNIPSLPPDVLSTDVFKIWRQWGSLFPNCDGSRNKRQSPISIDTESAESDEITQTLFVYSSTPLNDYMISLNHTFPNSNTSIDLVTLKLNSEKFHEATYISGLGDISYRFFHSAFFLFSRQESTHPELSLHVLDNKRFPMEIILNFNQQCGNSSCGDETQIHVMVEVEPVENPLFKPLVDALNTIKDSSERMTEILKVVGKQEDNIKNLTSQRQLLNEEWKSMGFENHSQTLPHLVKSVDKKIAEIKLREGEIRKAEERIRALEEKVGIYREQMEEKKLQQQQIVEVLKEVAERLSDCFNSECSNPFKALLEQYQKEDGRYAAEIKEIEFNMNVMNRSSEVVKEKRQRIQAKIDALNKSMTKELAKNGFKDPADALRLNKELGERARKLETIRFNLDRATQTLKELSEATKPEAAVAIFQASWLLPPIGGHYRYDGSSPIPPCDYKSYTIVMEKSVIISPTQFEAFASVTNARRTEPLGDALPVMHGLNDRQVFFNKKNLQYILDDDVHMRSKLRKRLKDAAKAGSESSCSDVFLLSIFALHTIKLISVIF